MKTGKEELHIWAVRTKRMHYFTLNLFQ